MSCDSYIASWSLITFYTMLRNTVDDTPCIGHKSISVRCPCTTPPKKIHKPTPTSKPTPEVTVADRVPAKCDFSQRARQVEFRRKALAHTLFTVIQQIIFRRKVSAHADFNISKHGLMVVPGGIICTLFNFNLQENHIPPATSYSPILKYFFYYSFLSSFSCATRAHAGRLKIWQFCRMEPLTKRIDRWRYHSITSTCTGGWRSSRGSNYSLSTVTS